MTRPTPPLARSWLALGLSAALSGCGTPSFCQVPGQAQSTALLSRESSAPLRLSWDTSQQRATRLHGAFWSREDSPEAAVRAFLVRYTDALGFLPDPASLVLRDTRVGRSGLYLRLQQTTKGLDVLGGEIIARVEEAPGGYWLTDLTLSQEDVSSVHPPTTPKFSEEEAQRAALDWLRQHQAAFSLGAMPQAARLAVMPGREARLVYVLALANERRGDVEIIADAMTGEVLSARDLTWRAEGQGLVFNPSPVASTGNANLRDQDDQDSAALDAARQAVLLPRLDGSGFLRGALVESKNPQTRAFSPALLFQFSRSDARFEEVMAYFHLDRAQARVQSLGFFNVNHRRQVATVNGITDDNSFYSPLTKGIVYGSGGVDDAEDADIIIHEYGHAVQDDQIPGFGNSTSAQAMGEGFSDYLAGSFLDVLTPEVANPACVGDWDSTSYDDRNPPCLRRLDVTKHFPEGSVGEIHADGEMWSSALFAARAQVGADVMDTLVIEAHFLQSTDESFAGAFETLLATDENLFQGAHLSALRRAFVEQGISRQTNPSPTLTELVEVRPVLVENPREGGLYAPFLDDSQFVTVPGAQGLRLRFSAFETEQNPVCFEGDCDSVYLYDGAGNLFQILSGPLGETTSVVIPGDRVRVRLVSDVTVGAFGYRIEEVEVLASAPPADCGDGLLQTGETCDGAEFGGRSCADEGFSGGSLQCRNNCTLDTSACEGEGQCGNGVIDAGEACDGANVGGLSCVDEGFSGGNLSCGPDCQVKTDECTLCGDGILSDNELCEGTNLGGLDCEAVGLANGVLRCSGACTLDTSACFAAECRE